MHLPPGSVPLPYTTLFRSSVATVDRRDLWRAQTPQLFRYGLLRQALESAREAGRLVTDEASALEQAGHAPCLVPGTDRKSTRLNSSHVKNSYAVFCLKKKK